MEVYIYPQVPKVSKAVFLFGAFETLHRGHKQIYDKGTLLREWHDYKIILVPAIDPRELPKVRKPGILHQNFMQLHNRLQLYADLGVDAVVLWEFKKVEHLPLEEFVAPFRGLEDVYFLVGQDWKGGYGGKTGATELKDLHTKTTIVEIFNIEQQKVATSMLKQQLKYGHIQFINQQLLRPYALTVTVKENKFSYPDELAKLHAGIYLCYIELGDKKYPALMHLATLENNLIPLLDEHKFDDGTFVIEVVDILRIITNIARDKVTEEDMQRAQRFFLVYQNDDEHQKELGF